MSSSTVAAALARRIANHLGAGYQPSINGRRVVLRDVVLFRASGDEAPAAAEERRQAASRGISIDISYWIAKQQSSSRGTNASHSTLQVTIASLLKRAIRRGSSRHRVAASMLRHPPPPNKVAHAHPSCQSWQGHNRQSIISWQSDHYHDGRYDAGMLFSG